MLLELCGKDEALLQNVPGEVWNSLPQPDRDAFYQLKNQLNRKSNRNEKYQNSFHDELERIKAYTNRSEVHVQERSIITGILFAANLICVNNQQLKKLINRCKSSINNGFQQMGYLSTKAKVKKYIETFLPILSKYPKLSRQWTLRYSEPRKSAAQCNQIMSTKRIQYPIPIFTPPAPVDIPNLSISCTTNDVSDNHDISFYDDFPIDSKDQISPTPLNDDYQISFGWDMIEKESSTIPFPGEFNDEPTIDYQND